MVTEVPAEIVSVYDAVGLDAPSAWSATDVTASSWPVFWIEISEHCEA